MQEARLKIKMDLGPDAVILHSRTFKKGGFLGFGGKEVVEVLAALEVNPAGGEPRAARGRNAPCTCASALIGHDAGASSAPASPQDHFISSVQIAVMYSRDFSLQVGMKKPAALCSSGITTSGAVAISGSMKASDPAIPFA